MRSNSSAAITALSQAPNQGLRPRNYVTVWPWEIAGGGGKGAVVELGFWTGALNVSLEVIDPDTGAADMRNFVGGQSVVVEIAPIRLTAGLRIKTVSIKLSGIDPAVRSALALHHWDRAPVQIHRVPHSPISSLPVAAPRTRFVGFVDQVSIPRPRANSAGPVTLHCASETVTYTRRNHARRSHQSHRERRGTDDIYQYVDTVADWEEAWGGAAGPADGGSAS